MKDTTLYANTELEPQMAKKMPIMSRHCCVLVWLNRKIHALQPIVRDSHAYPTLPNNHISNVFTKS